MNTTKFVGSQKFSTALLAFVSEMMPRNSKIPFSWKYMPPPLSPLHTLEPGTKQKYSFYQRKIIRKVVLYIIFITYRFWILHKTRCQRESQHRNLELNVDIPCHSPQACALDAVHGWAYRVHWNPNRRRYHLCRSLHSNRADPNPINKSVARMQWTLPPSPTVSKRCH